ncbi:MAG: hypothetical protein HKP53_09700 [Eudoraea sp.]|nr:hypothetical protein [Eudoraea sp.]
MKPFNSLKLSLTISLLLLCSLSYGQATEAVLITLTVDTSQLGDERNAPGGCTLTASPSSVVIPGDANPKMFTVKVKNGTDIEWEGVTQDGDEVKIKKIGFLKGINIFNSKNVPGKVKNGKEKVKAKIKRKTAAGLDYEYLIEFKIKGFGTYILDPRIKVE